jgi:2-dehydropantoate 2-reductase
MRVLIVGAGAVGQVFGHHLARGGAEVSFLVKPKYAEDCRRGFTLYALDRKPPRAQRFTGFGVITAPAEAAATQWDQIYLTVSSIALTAGGWLAELAAATGDAAIVFLQPNLDDRAFVTSVVDPGRVVDGVIGFVSYHAPLPGETRFAEPGIAYWFPPAPSPFSGARAPEVVAALRRGKLPAKRIRDVTATAPFQSAVLYAYLVALEAAQWSFRELRSGDRMELAGRTAAQAMVIAGHQRGRRVPWRARFVARPFVIRLVLRLARRFIPLDLETYLRVHFTKFGDQTRAGIQSYIAHGQQAGLATDAIEQLAAEAAA